MSTAMVMMGLGVFRFGISNGAYQTLRRTAPYRWGKVERIGRMPALQYLGPDTQDLGIEGVIYPHFKGGLRQVELMRAKAGTGAPHMMVDGLGFVFHRWVITSVEERKSHFLRDGAPRKIEFALNLQSYGPDMGLASVSLGSLF